MQSTKLKIAILISLVGILPARLSFAQTAASSASAPDSLTVQVRDSPTAQAPDSLVLQRDSLSFQQDSLTLQIDSLAMQADSLPAPADSTIAALADTAKVYTEKELRKMQRDSIRAVKDSIRLATPRLLETCAFDDSLYFKRILVFNSDRYFNNINRTKLDTTFNDWYTEYPYFKEDVNATYLGIVGSAAQSYNYFKRKELDVSPFFEPYLSYTNLPDDFKFYNTKSPYTELGYWGTIFSYREKEESSVKFLHTQNVTPALNLAMLYTQWGASGLLTREKTNNRTISFTGNYLGKRYVAAGGWMHNIIKREENGGVQNSGDVLDTIVDAKTIAVNLAEAANRLVKNTIFINQSYGIPINFKHRGDTLAIGDGTMAYFGHSGEYSTYSKTYSDKISDAVGKEFYHNNFYINPVNSLDSIRVMQLENKLFFKLQPWAKDAIVSNISGGVGYQYLSLYSFNPDMFLKGNGNTYQNNLYAYADARGQFRKYFAWDAFGKYQFAGYYLNDFEINANARFSFYPFKEKDQGINLTARFSTSRKRPDFYSNHLYTNHYIWNNDFQKVAKTKIEGELTIPKWKLSAFFGYSIINNNLYYDTLGVIRQSPDLINVLSAYLQKDFKIWYFHLDNQVLFQMSSKQDVLPLPMLSVHLRYYFQYELVKGVMTMQVGADATYNTAYYAPAYNPATGAFQIQNQEKVGNCPYIDVFANFQWKRACIFLKCVNVNQGWPSADYFSAFHYIKPKRAFKVGIYWPFYIH